MKLAKDLKKARAVSNALLKASAAHPQLRIGQLIDNAVAVACGPNGSVDDLYYITDDELRRAIERYTEIAKP